MKRNTDTTDQESHEQTGHTPGPWQVVEASEFIIIHADEGAISVAGMPTEYEDKATVLADARLIAAAPELLEACKKLLESTWDIVVPSHPTLANTQAQAQAAIAKAGG